MLNNNDKNQKNQKNQNIKIAECRESQNNKKIKELYEEISKKVDLPFGFCSIKNIGTPKIVRSKRGDFISAVLFLFPYKVKNERPKNISRYAAVPDYHNYIIPFLKEIATDLNIKFAPFNFKAYSDYTPVLEAKAAGFAGLGSIGKNGLLINEKYGSFCFIGSILTDMDLPNSKSGLTYCNNCGLCLKNCPVNLNKEICVSDISQKKQDLTDSEIKLLKKAGSCFGCDICQEVCPLNKNTKLTKISFFINGYRDEYILNEDSAGRAYNWRSEDIIKRNFKLLAKKTP